MEGWGVCGADVVRTWSRGVAVAASGTIESCAEVGASSVLRRALRHGSRPTFRTSSTPSVLARPPQAAGVQGVQRGHTKPYIIKTLHHQNPTPPNPAPPTLHMRCPHPAHALPAGA